MEQEEVITAPKAHQWWNLEEKGTLFGIRLVLLVYRWFGRLPFLLVLYPVVSYYFVANAVARRSSIAFLRKVRQTRVFYPQQSLYRLSFRHFLTFAEGLLDKLISWTGAITYQNVHFPDRSHFFELMDKSQGAVIIGSHLGNLEVMRALSSYNARIKLNILVHTRHAEKFNQLLQGSSEDAGIHMLQVTEINPATAMLLRTKIAAGEFVVIVGDRIPVADDRQRDMTNRVSIVDFLGSKAELPQGPYLIAHLLKCPVYTLFCYREEKRHVVEFMPFAARISLRRGRRSEDLAVYVQKFAEILQEKALLVPLQWNNFFPFWADKTDL